MSSVIQQNLPAVLAVIGIAVLVLVMAVSVTRSRSRRFGRRYSVSVKRKRRIPIDSAAAAAVLAQRLTGDGSGPYSGTPFPVADDAVENDERSTETVGSYEGPSHERGIIDHSRHVSAIGRR